MTEPVDRLLADARARLAGAPFRPSTREAALLLAHALGLGEAQVLARQGEEVPRGAAERFRRLLARRLTGEPFAYLVGEREFYGRSFAVDRRVLIPRPETEHLIEAALAERLPAEPTVLDLGTGSGCIAVTLALEIPGARLLATDRSPAALAVAAANLRRHRLEDRVRLAAADLGRGVRLDSVDLVVSNPPYLDPADATDLSVEVRDWEPHVALFTPGPNREFPARLLAAFEHLRPRVALLLEIGPDQVAAIETAAAASPFAVEEIRRDYAGRQRIVVLRRG